MRAEETRARHCEDGGKATGQAHSSPTSWKVRKGFSPEPPQEPACRLPDSSPVRRGRTPGSRTEREEPVASTRRFVAVCFGGIGSTVTQEGAPVAFPRGPRPAAPHVTKCPWAPAMAQPNPRPPVRLARVLPCQLGPRCLCTAPRMPMAAVSAHGPHAAARRLLAALSPCGGRGAERRRAPPGPVRVQRGAGSRRSPGGPTVQATPPAGAGVRQALSAPAGACSAGQGPSRSPACPGCAAPVKHEAAHVAASGPPASARGLRTLGTVLTLGRRGDTPPSQDRARNHRRRNQREATPRAAPGRAKGQRAWCWAARGAAGGLLSCTCRVGRTGRREDTPRRGQSSTPRPHRGGPAPAVRGWTEHQRTTEDGEQSRGAKVICCPATPGVSVAFFHPDT